MATARSFFSPSPGWPVVPGDALTLRTGRPVGFSATEATAPATTRVSTPRPMSVQGVLARAGRGSGTDGRGVRGSISAGCRSMGSLHVTVHWSLPARVSVHAVSVSVEVAVFFALLDPPVLQVHHLVGVRDDA